MGFFKPTMSPEDGGGDMRLPQEGPESHAAGVRRSIAGDGCVLQLHRNLNKLLYQAQLFKKKHTHTHTHTKTHARTQNLFKLVAGGCRRLQKRARVSTASSLFFLFFLSFTLVSVKLQDYLLS